MEKLNRGEVPSDGGLLVIKNQNSREAMNFEQERKHLRLVKQIQPRPPSLLFHKLKPLVFCFNLSSSCDIDEPDRGSAPLSFLGS